MQQRKSSKTWSPFAEVMTKYQVYYFFPERAVSTVWLLLAWVISIIPTDIKTRTAPHTEKIFFSGSSGHLYYILSVYVCVSVCILKYGSSYHHQIR